MSKTIRNKRAWEKNDRTPRYVRSRVISQKALDSMVDEQLPVRNRLVVQANKWSSRLGTGQNIAGTYELDHCGDQFCYFYFKHGGKYYTAAGPLVAAKALLDDPAVSRIEVTDGSKNRLALLVKVEAGWRNFCFTRHATMIHLSLGIQSAKKQIA